MFWIICDVFELYVIGDSWTFPVDWGWRLPFKPPCYPPPGSAGPKCRVVGGGWWVVGPVGMAAVTVRCRHGPARLQPPGSSVAERQQAAQHRGRAPWHVTRDTWQRHGMTWRAEQTADHNDASPTVSADLLCVCSRRVRDQEHGNN